MLEIEKSADAYIVRSGNLLVRFEYSTDRWRHAIAVCGTREQPFLLSSEEGAPDDPRPPSPAFQELRLESIGSDVCEFQLFGQAGKGIYSAAVRFDGAAAEITFDVAARANRAGAEIHEGSAYAVAPTASYTVDPLTFSVPGDSAGVLLASRFPKFITPSNPHLIVIRQHGADESAVFQTSRNARWEYTFQLVRLP